MTNFESKVDKLGVPYHCYQIGMQDEHMVDLGAFIEKAKNDPEGAYVVVTANDSNLQKVKQTVNGREAGNIKIVTSYQYDKNPFWATKYNPTEKEKFITLAILFGIINGGNSGGINIYNLEQNTELISDICYLLKIFQEEFSKN